MKGRAFFLAALATCAVVASGCGGGDEAGSARTINWYVFNEPGGAFTGAIEKCNNEANGRYEIKYQRLPTDADQQRELIVRRLAAEDKSVDLIGMDVNWTAEFAEAEWIAEWTGENAQKATEGTIPKTLETAKYEDKLFTAPFTSNAQVLYYRKDLVPEPPKTWNEMLDISERLAGEGKPALIQVQGARYEGLVVWFNSLVESAGGEILSPEGDNVELGDAGIEAAEVMQRLATGPAADAALSNNKEDEARLNFEAGQSAFETNYTFAYASATTAVKEAKGPAKEDAQKFLDNLGVARFPGMDENRPSEVTLGGINIGVGAFSEKKDLAFEAALCLRQPDNQLAASQLGGLLPTSAEVFDRKEFTEALPFADLLKETVADGAVRPITPAYSDISLAVQRALHPAADISAEDTIEQLRDNVEKAKEGKIF